MFGYIGDLRTMTSGRGQFSMEFSHYAPCPKNVSDEVIAKAKAKEEALRAGKYAGSVSNSKPRRPTRAAGFFTEAV